MKDAPSEPVATLYRPVGEQELDLIRASGWRAFPPRLPEQPIFYPVLGENYAIQVEAEYLAQFPVQTAGSREHREYWIPAEELEEFNSHIVGLIEVVHKFHSP
jgi:hypothetical protein